MAITQKSAQAAETKAPVTAPAPVQTMKLELSRYSRYMRAGMLYEKQNAYEFTLEQASILLTETDPNDGHPIWRAYKPRPVEEMQVRKARLAGEKPVVNATTDATPVIEVDPRLAGSVRETEKRIDVGDDSELDDILTAADGEEAGGAVTV